jgi:hypothetical protein
MVDGGWSRSVESAPRGLTSEVGGAERWMRIRYAQMNGIKRTCETVSVWSAWRTRLKSGMAKAPISNADRIKNQRTRVWAERVATGSAELGRGSISCTGFTLAKWHLESLSDAENEAEWGVRQCPVLIGGYLSILPQKH